MTKQIHSNFVVLELQNIQTTTYILVTIIHHTVMYTKMELKLILRMTHRRQKRQWQGFQRQQG